MKKNLRCYAATLLLLSLTLISSTTLWSPNTSYASEDTMTFTSGETINFTSNTTMTFKSDEKMQFWSGVKMKFQTNISMQFIETEPNGILEPCDVLQITWPIGYLPPQCSWWEVIDPDTGEPLGEFHVDWYDPPNFHIDQVWPDNIPVPPGGKITAKKKIDVIEPCQYYEVHWPKDWYPEPCSWWEILDPETGELTGYEFHVDWTNESCEFHVDEVIPEPYYPPFPWYEIWARQKIPSIEPCDYFVVEDPADWYPEPCSWWEVIDFYTGELTGYEFHVDWTNESCEFHVDEVIPEPYHPPYPGIPYVIAEQKITNITTCDWFVIVDPVQFLPEPCSWWEILDDTGAATGSEFHIDTTDGITMFHVDETSPNIVIEIPPSYTVTVRKKIDIIQPCDWFRVDDPSLTPESCSWWEILDPATGEPTGYEFHVDQTIPEDGLFHVDEVWPGSFIPAPIYQLTAEKKIDAIQPCDWFVVIDPPSWVPEPCSWWEIIWPTEWAGVIFHVDANDEVSRFHIDTVDGEGVPPPPVPPPWNVTAKPYEPPPEPWYIKSPYPDYAPSGMPDFDEQQDAWGPAQGTYTWCGPVAVANSLWWLDSEYESLYCPSPVPPPTISDHFNLITSYNIAWDDHDVKNVDPLVHDLAWHMDTDGIRSGDGHIGTRWSDMEFGIKQYLIQQGVDELFEVHNYTFPSFFEIEEEIEICQDVVLFLEFWQELGPGEWQKLYDNPSLEYGHYVTCAGVNSTTVELLISDPYQDAYEKGVTPGRSPVSHPYPHPPNVHNDTQYVSHDAYNVSQWIEPPPSPYPGVPLWELVGYLQTLGYAPSWHTFIRAAVVTSPLGINDVAVTNVTTSKTGCVPMPTVGQDLTANVTVTVENQGNFTETFNVSAYANTTVIGTQRVENLPSGNQVVLTFVWNTTGWSKGNYTIKAIADQVTDEMETADNTFVDGWVMVVIAGDLEGDGDVDLYDAVILNVAYGSKPVDPQWNPNADIVEDNHVNLYDAVVQNVNYGQKDC